MNRSQGARDANRPSGAGEFGGGAELRAAAPSSRGVPAAAADPVRSSVAGALFIRVTKLSTAIAFRDRPHIHHENAACEVRHKLISAKADTELTAGIKIGLQNAHVTARGPLKVLVTLRESELARNGNCP